MLLARSLINVLRSTLAFVDHYSALRPHAPKLGELKLSLAATIAELEKMPDVLPSPDGTAQHPTLEAPHGEQAPKP